MNRKLLKLSLLAAVMLLGQACKHPIVIFGEGDVLSASNTRNCLLEEFQAGLPNCTQNETVNSAYVETYTAVPRPGWQFRRWASYCNKTPQNTCSFNLTASAVQTLGDIAAGPLQAVFRDMDNTGLRSLFIGDAALQSVAAGIDAQALNAGFTDHSTVGVYAPGIQGSPQALWSNPVRRASIQAALDTGNIELVGMTYSPIHPAVESYSRWVNYALQKRPDTRFFISTPWSPDPGTLSSAEYAAAYESTHAQVHALVTSLRAKFPGVDFYCIPLGQGAVDLHHLYGENNLPDASALVGAPAEAVFTDTAGNPGNILQSIGELIFLGAIYRVDLASYEFDPGYATDLKSLAHTVLEGHDPAYDAPPEVDPDSDGDGTPDRHDPNPAGKPNILLMMVDDLGYNDLAINNGNTAIDTPHMDQLAQQGVRFNRHYSSPVCSPSRAALLTGIYPERLGYTPNGRGISPDVVTLPERLRQSGYTTWHFGKWHIGELERKSWPDYQGFDHWFGFLAQFYLAGVTSGGQLVPTAPRYLNPWLMGDTEPGKYYTGHLDDILTDKAIQALSQLHAAGAPWFVNLWFFAPHGPLQPSATFASQYPDNPAGRYRALVNQLDHNIGRVLSHLDTLGAAQDTIVVVVSDNGGTNNPIDNNAPFFGSKSNLLEGGVRTPLIIRWPDPALAGQVIDETVGIIDLYPTLLESANVTYDQNIDGDSFYPAVQASEPILLKERFWEIGAESYGVLSTDGRRRFVQLPPIWGAVPPPQLHDLELDPTGASKVLPPPAEEMTLLFEHYLDWYRSVHTVVTHNAIDASGQDTLTGSDFQRTPGYGPYTLGLAMSDTADGQLVQQAGIWEMSRSGNTVTAHFGNVHLAGEIQGGSACHSIVVTGKFARRLTNNSPPDSISLSLYIDGSLAQQVVMPAILQVSDTAVPTVIGSSGSPTPLLAPPVILNTELRATTPWTIADFSQELCAIDI